MAKKGSFEARLAAKAKKIEKKKEERASSGGGFAQMFKPRAGENYIRFLPHWSKTNDELDENEFFFVEKVIHYIPKVLESGSTINIPVPCLATGEESCPMCDAVTQLRAKVSRLKDAKKDQAAKSNETKFRKIRKQTKALYNILDYGVKGEIDPNICVWACPETVHEDIMTWAGDLGDFSDLDEGRDWRIKKNIDVKRGPIGTTYKVFPNMKDTKVPTKLRDLLDSRYDLNTIWADDPRADMEKALEILGVELEKTPEPEAKKKTKTKTKRVGATKSKPKKEAAEEPAEDEDYDPTAGFPDAAEEEDSNENLAEDLGIEASDDELETELEDLGIK